MQELQANTQVKVRIGPFVDVSDGKTPETGITLGAADEAELLKHNGAATADISSNAWAAVTSCDGWYDLTLTAGNLDTEGQLKVVVQDDSECLPVHVDFMVVSQAYWKSKYDEKDEGFVDVNVKTIGRADAQETEADNLETACSNYSAARGLTGTAVPDAAAGAENGMPTVNASNQVSALLADGVHGGSNFALTGKSITITNSAGDAVSFISSGSNGDGFVCSGNGSGNGILVLGGATGHGVYANGGSSSGDGLRIESTYGNGIWAFSAEGPGMKLSGGDGGAGLYCLGSGGTEAIVAAEFSGSVGSIVAAVTTDAASRTASKADVSALATALQTVDNEVGAIQSDLDNATDGLGALKTLLDAVSTHDAAAVVTALMAYTGITAGGTMTFETWCKVVGAAVAGDFKDKAGGGYELFDVEDGTTVIFSQTISETTPYRDTTME